jgi:hypothetical protein
VACASGCKRPVEFQIGDYISNLFQTPLYFGRIGEARSHAPPNPRQTVWNSEFIFQFANHSGISISIEEGQRQSKPLRVGRYCDQVQQENQQIVRLSRFRGHGLVVHNSKVDQTSPAGFLIIEHIVCSCVAVRLRPAKLIAPELMSASEFVARRFDHFARELPLF